MAFPERSTLIPCLDEGYALQLLQVGSGSRMELYVHRLVARVRGLEIREQVMFLGLVSLSGPLACHRAAHVFVGMSKREGFCVPLAESRLLEVPVAGPDAGSMPETLGDAGILVLSKAIAPGMILR